MQVNFYDQIEDDLLKYTVMISRYENQWVFVKHKQRDTLECPGGKREQNESIETCAKRELYEETGATSFSLTPLCIYSVVREHEPESFGMLYVAQITEFDPLPESEIEKIQLLEKLPNNWTYPQIQPYLCKYAINHCEELKNAG